MLSVVKNEEVRDDTRSVLDEIAREGARSMLMAALREEADAYVTQFVDEVGHDGHRLVTRNGTARERTVTTVAGALKVQAPRVDDQRVNEDGNKQSFRSEILPPWCRKSPGVVEVLPLLYLRGLSTSDFTPALSEFFGTNAGLSAPVIARLVKSFQDDYKAFWPTACTSTFVLKTSVFVRSCSSACASTAAKSSLPCPMDIENQRVAGLTCCAAHAVVA